MSATPEFAGYRVLASLGHGGMARVFVLKALKEDFVNDADLLAMFVQEARIAARLNHANVVQTYEVGDAGGTPFIAMEFLEGQPLNAIHRRFLSSLPLDLHMRVFADVLSGLHYAHELTDFDGKSMGLVHRDVSPHNIFVTYDGVAKVLDFGIAKVANAPSVTQTGVMKGKIGYMAREQILNHALDRRADVFSVGVMMFEALTGQRLVKPGTADVAALQERLTGNYPSVRQLAKNVPEELIAIADKAMQAEPADRFATAEEMQTAIEDYLRTASNPQPRDLGKLLRERFDVERHALKKTIEDQLAHPSKSIATVAAATVGAESSPVPIAGTSSDTEVIPPPSGARGMQRLVTLLVVAVLAVGGLFVFLRTRGGGASATTSASPVPMPDPVASAPPSAPAPSASAAAAATARIALNVQPKEAQLTLDGEPLAPGDSIVRPIDATPHVLGVSAPGYRPSTQPLVFDKDQTLTIELSLAGKAGSPPAVASPQRGGRGGGPRPPPSPAQPTATTATTAPAAPGTAFPEVGKRNPRPIDTSTPF
jgi:eukaryotic-like serine/threonine-protein kinase